MLATLTATLTALLMYLALRRVSAHRAAAVALTLVFVVRAPHDVNHHMLTTAASMAAALALLSSIDRPRFVAGCCAAGVFAGLAAMITQSRGAALAGGIVAVLLSVPERARRVAWAVAGMTIVPAAAIVYLASVGALDDAFQDAVMFPLQRYSGIGVVHYGAFASLADAGIVLFIPLTLLLTLVALGADVWRTPHARAALVLAIIALVSAFPRPDTPHLTYTMPLAAPLGALAVKALLERMNAPSYRMPVRAALIGVCIVHIGYSVAGRASVLFLPRQQIATARGIVERHTDGWTGEFAWLIDGIQRHTAAGDNVLFYPNMSLVPYLTARRQTAHVDMIIPGFTTPAQYRDVCAEVVADAQYVVIDRAWTKPENILHVHPSTADPDPPEKRAFEAMLREGFELIAHSPTFEVRRRTARAAASLCGRIDVAYEASRRH
jgi:hypothetical protein